MEETYVRRPKRLVRKPRTTGSESGVPREDTAGCFPDSRHVTVLCALRAGDELMNVLIVDDSAAIRKILKRVLQQAEIPTGQVYEASDGVEAIQRLKEGQVQLILSDINMPNMDGLQFLSHVKNTPEWKHVPVVMVTTEGSQSKVLEAVALGAVGYVRKPFTAEQIKEKLTGIM
jgi:two-component system chemotaxis response regulator CheY